jgi:hypothetical protein
MARTDSGASDGRNVQPVHNERAAVVKNLRASMPGGKSSDEN